MGKVYGYYYVGNKHSDAFEKTRQLKEAGAENVYFDRSVKMPHLHTLFGRLKKDDTLIITSKHDLGKKVYIYIELCSSCKAVGANFRCLEEDCLNFDGASLSAEDCISKIYLFDKPNHIDMVEPTLTDVPKFGEPVGLKASVSDPAYILSKVKQVNELLKLGNTVSEACLEAGIRKTIYMQFVKDNPAYSIDRNKVEPSKQINLTGQRKARRATFPLTEYDFNLIVCLIRVGVPIHKACNMARVPYSVFHSMFLRKGIDKIEVDKEKEDLFLLKLSKDIAKDLEDGMEMQQITKKYGISKSMYRKLMVFKGDDDLCQIGIIDTLDKYNMANGYIENGFTAKKACEMVGLSTGTYFYYKNAFGKSKDYDKTIIVHRINEARLGGMLVADACRCFKIDVQSYNYLMHKWNTQEPEAYAKFKDKLDNRACLRAKIATMEDKGFSRSTILKELGISSAVYEKYSVR